MHLLGLGLLSQARVRAAGGRIVFNSGSYRVMGMLAMSRAIGDHFLRPYVIAEPEVRHVLFVSLFAVCFESCCVRARAAPRIIPTHRLCCMHARSHLHVAVQQA